MSSLVCRRRHIQVIQLLQCVQGAARQSVLAVLGPNARTADEAGRATMAALLVPVDLRLVDVMTPSVDCVTSRHGAHTALFRAIAFCRNESCAPCASATLAPARAQMNVCLRIETEMSGIPMLSMCHMGRRC